MAGIFELFIDAQSRYRFRLMAPDGTMMAVSRGFDNKRAAVAGIRDVREYAGMGLIADLCRGEPPAPASPTDNPLPRLGPAAGPAAKTPVRRTFLTRRWSRMSPVGFA